MKLLALFFILFVFFIAVSIVYYVSNISNASNASNDDTMKLGLTDMNAPYTEPVVYPNLISSQEAEYIINTSLSHFKDSTIVSGKDLSVRKSQTNTLNNNDPTIHSIIERICNIVNYPIENVEPIQVVKYDSDGYYNAHYDSCPDNNDFCRSFVANGGQRVITVVIYLNDDFSGGHTTFIHLKKDFKPTKGSGLIFYSMDKNNTRTHPLSLHEGSPLTKGTKYIANVWIRENAYR
jgi:prolyl 4-hydroxylase